MNCSEIGLGHHGLVMPRKFTNKASSSYILNFSLFSRTGLDKARWKIFKSRAKEVENPVI